MSTTWSSSLQYGPGNVTLTGSSLIEEYNNFGSWAEVLSTTNPSSGKRYVEFVPANFPWYVPVLSTVSPTIVIGIDDDNTSVVTNHKYPGNDVHGVGWMSDGTTHQASGLVMPAMAPGAVYGMAVDWTNNKLWWAHKPYISLWNPYLSYSHYFVGVTNTGLSGQRQSGTGNSSSCIGTVFRGAGKLHLEFTFTGASGSANTIAGMVNASYDSVSTLQYPGQTTTQGIGVNGAGGTAALAGLSLPSFAIGNVLAIEIDFTAKKVWLANSSNGLWNNAAIGSQNPATGTGGISFSTISGSLVPCCAFFDDSGIITLNTTGSFAVTPSSGFSAWDSSADTIWWNNDVIANQNPATNTGGISISGLSSARYAAAGSWATTVGKMAAKFNKTASTFTYTIPSGFTDWDATGGVVSQTAVSLG